MEHYVRKILIVEDDLSLRPLWESFFSDRAVDVALEWAISSEEALKMVQGSNETGSPYFLIITDIFLAGSGTGMELLQSSDVAKSKAKTILISSADRNDIVEKFGHLIPDTIVISKPLDFKKYDPIFKKILKPDTGQPGREKGA